MKAGDRVVRKDTGEHGVITAIRPGVDQRPTTGRFYGDEKGEQGYVHLGEFVAEGAEPVTHYEAKEVPDLAPWTLKTSPEAYLERYPDGKHADLARLHVG